MHRAVSRPLTLLAGTAAGLATVLATLAAPAQAGDDPDAGRPEVGSCHDLTVESGAGESDTAPPVSCSSEHTTLTIAVPDSPRNPRWSSPALQKWTIRSCQRELIAFFGRDVERLARSSFAIYYFYPTTAERRAGAEWVRCDVALLGDVTLRDLPRDRDPALGRLRDDVASCIAPRSREYRQTVCARPHSYRAEATVRSAQRTYPSERGWGRLSRRCPPRAPYYRYPDRSVYKAGSVHLICFAKTRR